MAVFYYPAFTGDVHIALVYARTLIEFKTWKLPINIRDTWYTAWGLLDNDSEPEPPGSNRGSGTQIGAAKRPKKKNMLGPSEGWGESPDGTSPGAATRATSIQVTLVIPSFPEVAATSAPTPFVTDRCCAHPCSTRESPSLK